MNTILVATDLSSKDEKLLTRGIQFAVETGAQLHILHVHYTVRIPSIIDRSKEEHAEIRNSIDALISKNPLSENVEYKVHIADGGRIYNQIDSYAKSIFADILIMGTSNSSQNLPDFALRTLERVLMTASYPVLIVANEEQITYSNIAIYTPFDSSVIKALNIINPITRNNKVNIYGYLDTPLKGIHLLSYLRHAYRRWKEKKLRKEIEGIVGEKSTFIKHKQGGLIDLPKAISSLNIGILALQPLMDGLFNGKPEQELRDILMRPPCDVLMIERGTWL